MENDGAILWSKGLAKTRFDFNFQFDFIFNGPAFCSWNLSSLNLAVELRATDPRFFERFIRFIVTSANQRMFFAVFAIG